MKKFRFLEWQVYKDAKELFNFILKLVKKLPKEYRYELGSQIIRSALSVVLNIAEGSGKVSDKEMNRFFDISLGSLYETLSSADILHDNKLIDKVEFDRISNMASVIANQIGGFKKRLGK